LDIKSEVAGGTVIYRLAGRIDASTGPNLESAVSSVIDQGTPRVIFDMRAVTYISSAGLRVVLSSAKRAKAAKGGLAVFGLQPAVNEVFAVSGFQHVLPIASDENDARSRLGA
jgi:anti-anti-sigma factor